MDTYGRFSITVSYDKSNPNPEKVFIGIAKLIESFQLLDRQLVSCVDSDIRAEIVLDDVEKGSIKLWLASVLRSVDDKNILSGDYKKIIGPFLVRGKYYILGKLESVDRIEDVEFVEALEDGICDIAKESGINNLQCYTKPTREQLLEGISKIGEAYEQFGENEIIRMTDTEGRVISLNKNFRLPMSDVSEFCSGNIIENDTECILKVRRPDFLGAAEWEFRLGLQTICGAIKDEGWLERYQSQKEIVGPGDSLRVILHDTTTYDKNNNPTKHKYYVKRVIEVIHVEKTEEIPLNIE